MRNITIGGWLGLCVLLVSSGWVHADCLIRKDGRSFSGRVEPRAHGYRLIRANGPDLYFRRSAVAAIRKGTDCTRRPPASERSGTVAPAVPTSARSPGPAIPRVRLSKRPFRGEPISLNVVHADLRDVLHLLADSGGYNLVVAPDVQGEVTLNVRDVPWDQLFDLLVHMYGYAYHRVGTVLIVAPRDRILQMHDP